MKDIAIYGAGGFGREIACLLSKINELTPIWNFIGFFDDGKKNGYRTEYGEVLGGIDDVNRYSKSLSIIIAIGKPSTAKNIVSSISNCNIDFPNIIAPDIDILDKNNYSFGIGKLICSKCWLSCNVHLGNFNILNIGTTIGHDSTLGNFNSLMPGTKISGEVKVGNRNFFGVSSVVLQQISIGNDTIIGANSLILKKTKDGETYIGNPATKVKF